MKNIGQYNGEPVYEVTLTNPTGVQVSIMSYGAIVRDWKVPTPQGLRSVVLGFPNYESYLNDVAHLGAIIGRVANRVSNAQFTLHQKKYSLQPNVGFDQLHGGPFGLSRRNWQMRYQDNSVVLSYNSPHGEMGYPGDVQFIAKYTLEGFQLKLEIQAHVSETTPINMVQHHYFNLMGHGPVMDHEFCIQADRYTPLTEKLTPTGQILSVDQTQFDFRSFRKLRDAQQQLITYDVNLCLALPDRSQPVAIVKAPDRSLTLKLWTDQPGVQFYTSEYLNTVDAGHYGQRYQKHEGFCLEDQMFPDALNHPHFPSILVSPDKPYSHHCTIEISQESR